MSARSIREPLDSGVEWFLLDGDRDVIALGLLVLVFSVFAWMRSAGLVDVGRNVTSIPSLFQMLGAGNFTLVTIVISINQLVLSRELRTPRELRSEQEAASEYRSSVEEEIDRPVVPESTENFLVVLVRDTREVLEQLEDEVDGIDDSEVREDADEFQSTLARELDAAMELLEESDVGVFRALRTILDADFSTCTNHSRWFRNAHG